MLISQIPYVSPTQPGGGGGGGGSLIGALVSQSQTPEEVGTGRKCHMITGI